jgi:hypothetical protein
MQKPRTAGTVSILIVFHQKCLCLIPVVGSQYRATTEAAERLIAQINSQSKHILRHENEILKAKERAP